MVDDGRTDDRRTPDHGHPISSPCEPNGSGELKTTKMIFNLKPITHSMFLVNFRKLFIIISAVVVHKSSQFIVTRSISGTDHVVCCAELVVMLWDVVLP